MGTCWAAATWKMRSTDDPRFEVQFGGHDALHRSILARRIGCSVRGEDLACRDVRSHPPRPVITRFPAVSPTSVSPPVERIRRTAELRLPSDVTRARDPARDAHLRALAGASVLAPRRRRAGHRRGVRRGRRAALGEAPSAVVATAQDAARRRRRAGRTRAARPAARADLRRLVDLRLGRHPPHARVRLRARRASGLGDHRRRRPRQRIPQARTRRRLVRRAHRRPRPGARPRPRDRRGVHQRPAPARRRAIGMPSPPRGTRWPRSTPTATIVDPRPGSAGAAGRGDDRAHRRRPVGARRRTRLVVRLAHRRRVDHPRQLRRGHRHRRSGATTPRPAATPTSRRGSPRRWPRSAARRMSWPTLPTTRSSTGP